MPQMKTVESRNVHSVGYDPTTRLLAIRFKDKAGLPGKTIYQHAEVPTEHGDALMATDSVGTYYAAHIRGKFDHVQVEA